MLMLMQKNTTFKSVFLNENKKKKKEVVYVIVRYTLV